MMNSATNRLKEFTTAPGEPLIQKCKMNIHAGCLPVIITIFNRVRTVLDFAADAGPPYIQPYIIII